MLFPAILAANRVSCFAVIAVLSVCTPCSTDRAHGPALLSTTTPPTPRPSHQSAVSPLRRETPKIRSLTRVRLLLVPHVARYFLSSWIISRFLHLPFHWYIFPRSLSRGLLSLWFPPPVFPVPLLFLTIFPPTSLFSLLSQQTVL